MVSLRGTISSLLKDLAEKDRTISSLQSDLSSKDRKIKKLEKQKKLLSDKNFALQSGDLPKIVKKRVVEDTLKGQFSPAAISQFLKPKRTEGTGSRKGKPAITRSKKFTDRDFISAMPKLQISSKAYQSFRAEYGGFIPGKSTINKRFR